MPRKPVAAYACWVLLLAVAILPLANAQATAPLTPAGVYAKIDVETAKKSCPGYAEGSADFHKCLKHDYEMLFQNEGTVISGLTVGERWDNIQISSAGCKVLNIIINKGCFLATTDWTYLDDAFEVANSLGKTVQLIITPGVDTPAWVTAKIGSCDPLLPVNTLPGPLDCGKVTIEDFQQEQRADSHVLPLPWDHVYRHYWNEFLGLLQARYNIPTNPAFVAIAVARPNGASDEMILPTSAYKAKMGPPPGEAADKAWPILIQNSFPNRHEAFWNSDQAFVYAWTQTIDDYENIFSGLTLVLSPDAGNYFPELPTTPEDPALDTLDCAHATDYTYSCAAKTNILSYFLYHYTDGPNAKVTRVGGMTASSPTDAQKSRLGIGLGGVKLLTVTQPSLPTPLPPPLLGGAEFDHPVTSKKDKTEQEVGCPTWPTPCVSVPTPAEAAFTVLTAFFNATPAAYYYGGLAGTCEGKVGKTLVQYLEVPFQDVLNAKTLPPPAPSTLIPSLGTTSLQDLLAMASADLLAMANHEAVPPPPTCP